METIILEFIQSQEKHTSTLTGIIVMLIVVMFVLAIIYAKYLFDKDL